MTHEGFDPIGEAIIIVVSSDIKIFTVLAWLPAQTGWVSNPLPHVIDHETVTNAHGLRMDVFVRYINGMGCPLRLQSNTDLQSRCQLRTILYPYAQEQGYTGCCSLV